jgi:hypothetical protein
MDTAFDTAISCVTDHLLAVTTSGKDGKRLSPADFRSVLAIVKVLGGLQTRRGRRVVGNLAHMSTEQLMAEAAKFPELREAMAALEGK